MKAKTVQFSIREETAKGVGMLISMAAIDGFLADVRLDSSIREGPACISLSHVEIADPSQEMAPDALYIVTDCASLALPAAGPVHLVIMGRAPGGVRECSQVSYIAVRGLTLPQLCMRIQRVFERYNGWERKMHQLLVDGQSVDRILEECLPLVPSSILVHDKNMRIIGYKFHTEKGQADPLALSRPDEPMDSEAMRNFLNSAVLNGKGDPFSMRGPYFWKSATTGLNCLNLNVFEGNRFQFRVVFIPHEQDRDTRDSDIPLIMALGQLLKVSLGGACQPDSGRESGVLPQLLSKLIKGQQVSSKSLEGAVAQRRWGTSSDTYLLVVALSTMFGKTEIDSYYQFITLFNSLKAEFFDCCTFTIDDQGVALMNLTTNVMTPEKAASRLEQVARTHSCAMGISRSFRGIRGVNLAYRECRAVLHCFQHGQTACEKGLAQTIGTAALNIVDSCILDKLPAESLVFPGLFEVIHYDSEHGSELYHTIRAYVESNCSPTKSAKRLFVHRSTFQYRFEKALDLLEADLDDPGTQLALRLSFRLLDKCPHLKLKRI